MVIYTVKSGDNIRQISKSYDIVPERLQEVNGVGKAYTPIEGDTLMIPTNERCVYPKKDDTPESLAKRLHTTKRALYRKNPHLHRGTPGPLWIGVGGCKRGAIHLNGYCDQSSEKGRIQQALPYLSTLTDCGGEYRAGVGLIFPKTRWIGEARDWGVLPLLCPNLHNLPLEELPLLVPSVKARGYGGMVLSCGEYGEDTLCSALKQVVNSFHLQGVCLLFETRRSDFDARHKLYDFISEVGDGLLITADCVTTPWEERQDRLICETSSMVRRHLYEEIPYCAAHTKEGELSYIPLTQIHHEKEKNRAEKQQGSALTWEYPGGVMEIEDANSFLRGCCRLEQGKFAGASLHLNFTPRWIYTILDEVFTLEGGC